MHFLTLYLAYGGCYLINNWIPFRFDVLAIFTAIFAVGYFAIWIVIAVSIRVVSRKLNAKIGKN